MTMTHVLDEFDADPDAQWPPVTCPPWCQDAGRHRADDGGLHLGTQMYVQLSMAYRPHDEQDVGVCARQPAGRAAVVEVGAAGGTILLTAQEATEVARHLLNAAVEISA